MKTAEPNELNRGEITEEQQHVIDHLDGCHARVMAVAGSGKTTTMALRVRTLVGPRQIDPRSILVLMFNRLARDEFASKLADTNIPEQYRPKVYTFHSFSYRFINQMMKAGHMPQMELWTNDKEELVRRTAHRAIDEVCGRDGSEEIDVDLALESISLWKASLIPPARAGHRTDPRLPLVYDVFERMRREKRGLTFDDFVPAAVHILETNKSISQQWCNRMKYIICDEYQDVNYGQQRLIELVAGTKADVMVVGDDDQTIYEWRGARPSYIIREFKEVFSNKPHINYALSHSFRFGPVIAQAAENLIGFNTTRVEKGIVAHELSKASQVVLMPDRGDRQLDTEKAMADQIETLLHREQVPATRIAVLGRLFVQLDALQAEFLHRGIPFHVLGGSPFYQRKEIISLLNYARLGVLLDHPLTSDGVRHFLSIANMPARKLSRAKLEQAARSIAGSGNSLDYLLEQLSEGGETPFSSKQIERIIDLRSILRLIHSQAKEWKHQQIGHLLRWIIDETGYLAHFSNYYGKGEDSLERESAVESFLAYADGFRMAPLEFIEYLESLDTTQGRPLDQQILMTSIFRAKGLEYDHVFLPMCQEGYSPARSGEITPIFDTAGTVSPPQASEAIENERRLFYVGVTRAKKVVYIGTPSSVLAESSPSSAIPSRFVEELQLESVTDVLRPIQSYSDGMGDSAALIAAIQQARGAKWIRSALVSNYVSRLHDPQLIGEIVTMIAQKPEDPFAYK